MIAGHHYYGIYITSDNNEVVGNYIGTDYTGTVGLGSTLNGIDINGGANNTIGGTTAAARNVIADSGGDGIAIEGATATGNTVAGNYIGTDASGLLALGNAADGVLVENGAANNLIGGSTQAARNVISGNSGEGVVIFGAESFNTVQGNYIGTNATGTLALGNSGSGVQIVGADSNTVRDNLISGNMADGIHLTTDSANFNANGQFAELNVLQGNFIGVNAAGTEAISNAGDGVKLANGSHSNTIGGTAASERNVISGNLVAGIALEGGQTVDNIILGNYIGVDATGAHPLGNAGDGVSLANAAANIPGTANNIIGGRRGGSGECHQRKRRLRCSSS